MIKCVIQAKCTSKQEVEEEEETTKKEYIHFFRFLKAERNEKVWKDVENYYFFSLFLAFLFYFSFAEL